MTNPTNEGYTRRHIPNFLLLILLLILLSALGFVFLFFINRFTLCVQPLGGSRITVQPGNEYEDAGAETLLKGSIVFRGGIGVNARVTTAGTVDTSTAGTREIWYHAEFGCWDADALRIVEVADVEAPHITLQVIPGSYTIPGEPYREEGFSAWDQLDGDLTDSVTVREESGFVHYTVSDRAGNVARVSRKIYYVDPVPPEITLLEGSELTIQAGTPFQDPGCTVVDNSDGDISDSVQCEGTVDFYLAGTYRLTYTAVDSSGNEATAVRTVIVTPCEVAATVIPGEKIIYLTFDDGPGPYTEWLLDVLARYDAKATFFVVDTGYLSLCQRMVDEGHAVGIHSVTHNYRQIYASPEAFFQDLLTMQDLIYQNCGVKTYLMRFPGGSSNTVSRFSPGIMTYLTQAVEDCGFRYFDWNVDSNDAGGAKDSDEVFDNVAGGARNRNASVVLQHDIKDFSVAAVEKILAWGTANGYRFLALEMNSPTAHHGVNN